MELITAITVHPDTELDQEKICAALDKFTQDDSAFHFELKPFEIVLLGMNDLHLETIVSRLKHEAGFTVSEPRVVYRETIRTEAEAEGKYIRQMGGSGNYGHAKIRIEPNEAGKGYEFINNIKGGVIPREYIKPIDQGIQDAMQHGVLAGYQVVDVKATLYDGSYHEVDSNEMAFKIAGSMAFMEAARKAKPVLLEPMMDVEVTVPEEYIGTIIGDLNSRRGRIEGMRMVGGSQAIKATVPLSTMFGYGTPLRSSTQGHANYTIQFKRYEVASHPPLDDDNGPVAVRNNKPPNSRPPRAASQVFDR
jgi:elongation factor G